MPTYWPATLFEYAPAIGAATLWAVSAQIVNRGVYGLEKIRADKIGGILAALLFALTSGFLTIWMASGWLNPFAGLSAKVVLAGLFTYPIGTGLYYLCSVAMGRKAELAAQFANVKPAISIAIGILFFGETLDARGALTTVVILAGVAVVVVSAFQRSATGLATALGLSLAASWSAGEALVFAETGGASSIEIALAALASSLLITLAAAAVYCIVRRTKSPMAGMTPSIGLPFAVHGVLSFGLAYTLFFHSIRDIGLGQTIMITVAWPLLSAAIGVLRAKLAGEAFRVDRPMLLSMSLFAIASVGFVLSRP